MKEPEYFKQVEIFIRVVSRKMVPSFMVLIEFNLENYLSQDLLVIFKLKNLNLEETQMYSFLNHKSLILQSILKNMILLWWDLTGYLIKCKIKTLLNSFGILKISQFNQLKSMISRVKSYHLLAKLHQKSSLKQWETCHSIILQLYSLSLIVNKNISNKIKV